MVREPSPKTLFPAQAGVLELMHAALCRYRACINSSETGTGKTVTTVHLLKRFPEHKILVVCPKSVVPSWERALWDEGIPKERILGVTNYEKVRRGNTPFLDREPRLVWTVPKDTIFVWDEVHCCKSADTLNGQMLSAACGFLNILLSATACEDPSEMRHIGRVLQLHSGYDWFAWALANGCEKDPRRNLTMRDGEEGALALERMCSTIYPSRGGRVTRAQLPAAFRQNTIITDPIDFGSEEEMQAIYAEVQDEIDALIERAQSDKHGEHSGLTRLLRARQKVELLKIPAIVDMANELVDAGHSVVIFVNFSQTLKSLVERLPFAGSIHGGQTGTAGKKEREEQISLFQTDKIRILVVNSQAGGVGISLHDETGKHPRATLISPSFNAKEFAQVLGRVERAGMQSEAIQRVLVAANTVEEDVVAVLQAKLERLRTLHDFQVDAPADPQAVLDPAPKTTGPGDHARVGPSGTKMYRACPSYESQGGTNPAAEMGTRIHEAMEVDSPTNLHSDYEVHLYDQTQEVVRVIQGVHGVDHTWADFREIRLEIDLGRGYSTFGTCDRAMVKSLRGGAARAVACDWKFGQGEIDEPLDNDQGKSYALGLFQRWPALQELDFYFVVPRRDEVLHGRFTREMMPGIQEDLRNVHILAGEALAFWEQQETPPIQYMNPTVGVCDFCARVSYCEEFIRLRAEKTAAAYAADDGGYHASRIDDPARVAQLFEWVPALEKFCSGVRKRRLEMAANGVEFPGYEYVERSGKRSVTDVPAALATFHDRGFTTEDFLGAVENVSFRKLADFIASKAKRGEKKSSMQEFEGELVAREALKHTAPVRMLKRVGEE